MKNWYLILFCIIAHTRLWGQADNTAQISQLLENAWQNRVKNPAEAEKQALQALDLAQKSHQYTQADSAHNYLGLIYRNLKRTEDAIIHFKYAYSLRIKHGNVSGAANVLGNLGTAYREQGNYEMAIKTQLQGLEIHEKLADSALICDDLIELANTYEREGDFDKMRNSFFQCLDISTLNGYDERIAKSKYGIAVYYIYQNKPDSAIYWAQQTIEDAQNIDDATIALKAEGIIADAYNRLGDIPNASALYAKLISKVDTIHNISAGLRYTQYNNYAVFLNDNKNPDAALLYLSKARQTLGSDITLAESEIIATNFANSFTNLGNLDSALFYLSLANELKDSIYQQNRQSAITDSEARYDTKKARSQSRASLFELKKKEEKINQLNGILFTMPIIALVLIGFFWQKRRNAQILLQQKEQEFHQKIMYMVNDIENKTLVALQQGQEAARNKISMDLHEHVGSALMSLYLKWKLAQPNILEPVKALFTESITLLENTYQELRDISHQLKSGINAHYGIKTKIATILDNTLNGTGTSIQYHFNGQFEEGFDNSTLEIHLTAIVKELLCNTLKYAEATKVEFQLNRYEHELSMTYEDNGRGFDVQKNSNGIGMTNIRERVAEMGGTFSVDSVIGHGMIAFINIPI